MSSRRMSMLPPPKPSMQSQLVDASPQSSQRLSSWRKQVIDGDMVRAYEAYHRRPQSKSSSVNGKQQQAPNGFNAIRERDLQAAIELPSSVLIAQSFRRLLNSDEPLYDVVGKDQKSYLQREFLEEVGMLGSEEGARSRKDVMFPPSPPMTPKPARSRPVSTTEASERQICECCKTHFAR